MQSEIDLPKKFIYSFTQGRMKRHLKSFKLARENAIHLKIITNLAGYRSDDVYILFDTMISVFLNFKQRMNLGMNISTEFKHSKKKS